MRLGDRHLGVNSVWESGPSGTDGRLPAKTGHTARLHNFPITGRSDRRNISASRRRSLRKLQFLHHRLEARVLAQGIH
jgi:hypothetical protein